MFELFPKGLLKGFVFICSRLKQIQAKKHVKRLWKTSLLGGPPRASVYTAVSALSLAFNTVFLLGRFFFAIETGWFSEHVWLSSVQAIEGLAQIKAQAATGRWERALSALKKQGEELASTFHSERCINKEDQQRRPTKNDELYGPNMVLSVSNPSKSLTKTHPQKQKKKHHQLFPSSSSLSLWPRQQPRQLNWKLAPKSLLARRAASTGCHWLALFRGFLVLGLNKNRCFCFFLE